eukprot:6342046-Alexandrium_andersonii.AAC.1
MSAVRRRCCLEPGPRRRLLGARRSAWILAVFEIQETESGACFSKSFCSAPRWRPAPQRIATR